jgi:hypothetical protein
VDLSPHLISVLFAFFPGAQVRWDTVTTAFEGYAARTTFDVGTGDGRTVACELYTANRTEPPSNIRQFTFNDCRLEVQGAQDAEGVFCARIASPFGVTEAPDFMRLLVRDSLAGTPSASGESALANLELMLQLLDRGLGR